MDWVTEALMHWSDRPPWRVGDWDWLSLGSDAGRGLKGSP